MFSILEKLDSFKLGYVCSYEVANTVDNVNVKRILKILDLYLYRIKND